MSQNPPPVAPAGDSYSLPGPSRTNGLAVASMICSIAGFCVLFIGGLLGVILGLLGLAKTRNGYTGGRGMAIAGIVVGILSILTSVILSIVFYAVFQAGVKSTAPERGAARQFVIDLNHAKVSAAAAEATAELSPTQLEQLSEQLQSRGAFVDMTSSHMAVNSFNGTTTCSLSGTAKFAMGVLQYSITLVRQSDGNWKISAAQFQ